MNLITPPHPTQTLYNPESAKITGSCVKGANQHRQIMLSTAKPWRGQDREDVPALWANTPVGWVAQIWETRHMESNMVRGDIFKSGIERWKVVWVFVDLEI